ncbi:hypothetical protein [Shimia sp. SDUM112013]|uniref:phage integrase central domain-containing protein n=1 Tax=Shimia sp. SDUM112013 TaxID=3136160 RepID=UPI0032EDF221
MKWPLAVFLRSDEPRPGNKQRGGEPLLRKTAIQKKEREAERRAARREDISLAVITTYAFETRKAELTGDGTAGRWLSPLNTHVLPKLGKVPVTDLDQRDIRDTLTTIWHTKADTARKALNRLSVVLKRTATLGLDVDLQATEKAKNAAWQVATCSKEYPRNGLEGCARLLRCLRQFGTLRPP